MKKSDLNNCRLQVVAAASGEMCVVWVFLLQEQAVAPIYGCVQGLKENMGYLVGDCLLAASFLSYMGPFLSKYRDDLLAIWMTQVQCTGMCTLRYTCTLNSWKF